jgi:hypothetical protein
MVGLAQPGNGRYDVDRPGWLRLRERQRITGLSVAAVIGLVVALLLWLRESGVISPPGAP